VYTYLYILLVAYVSGTTLLGSTYHRADILLHDLGIALKVSE